MTHETVSRDDWLTARKKLLADEKAFTQAREKLAEQRRALPWVKIDKPYSFEGPDGTETFADLFAGKSQLIVYHFMFGPDWDEGCPSCSFWADTYSGTDVHLAARDASLVVISRAPLEKLDAYKARMGWDFKWVSSLESDFNFDFGVSFTPEEMAEGDITYNYAKTSFPSEEAPGFSTFCREGADVFHTYSCFARGLDMMNGAYQMLDLMPKGRDEAALNWPMEWVRRRDQY